MKKWTFKEIGVTLGFGLICTLFVEAVMMCGWFSPLPWIWMPPLAGLVTAIPYMYIVGREQRVGAIILMNLVALLLFGVAGEMNLITFIGIAGSTICAELIRRICGYDTAHGNLISFVFYAFTMSGKTLYIWADTEFTIAEAVEEMPAGYADKILQFTPGWVMMVMLFATVIFALLGGCIGKSVLKKQYAGMKP